MAQIKSDQKHIAYIFYGRYPSEKAHAVFVTKTCEAYAKLGYSVTLFVPDFGDREKYQNDGRYTFMIKRFPIIDFRKAGWGRKLRFYYAQLQFVRYVQTYLKKQPPTQIFTNDELAIMAAGAKDTICYELHDFPERNLWWYRYLLNRADHILITNTPKRTLLVKTFPTLKPTLFVEPNGVDVDQFSVTISKFEARQKLSLPVEEKIILYTGHLYDWKGVDILAEAAAHLDEEYMVYFVGGQPKHVEAFKETHGNNDRITVIGHRPHDEMPLWQKAADVLVLPNTATQDISKYYTSPMKLFEYMASGRPVVAAELPSVTEIVNEQMVTFFTPDDPFSLSEKIKLAAYGKGILPSDEAVKRFLAHYSWSERAKRILDSID